MCRNAQAIQHKRYVTWSFAIQKVSAEVLWEQEDHEQKETKETKLFYLLVNVNDANLSQIFISLLISHPW